MAVIGDISKMTLPSGNTYTLKDAWSREQISALQDIVSGSIVICGKTSTQLTDNATTNPIIIAETTTIRGVTYEADDEYTAVAGDAFFVTKTINGTSHNLEFVFDGTHWHEFGDMAGIGELAYKNSGSVTYIPSGDVSVELSTSTVTGSGTFTPSGDVSVELSSSTGGTTTIANPIAKTVVATADPGTLATCTMPTYTAPTCTMPTCTLPTFTAQVANEDLSISWAAGSYSNGSYTDGSYTDGSYTAGTLPTFTSADSITTSNVTVVSSETTYGVKSATFTGTQNQNVTVSSTVVSGVKSATFSGTTDTVSVTFA